MCQIKPITPQAILEISARYSKRLRKKLKKIIIMEKFKENIVSLILNLEVWDRKINQRS